MNLISIRGLERREIEKVLSLAEDMENSIEFDRFARESKQMENKKSSKKYDGKILATLFFEPSTRTRLSFQTAALRLGMQSVDLSPEISSLKKGESFIDTIKVVSGYADVLVVRHPNEGASMLAADSSQKPVINAGDGSNQHPTQTMIDLYTIKKNKGKFAGLKVFLVGDLKHARTMHSLVYALAMFGADITLVSPPNLEMDAELIDEIEEKFKASIKTTGELEFKNADVIYVCRIQEERFVDPYEVKRVKEQFTIKAEHLRNASPNVIILHPLPKLNEIDSSLEDSKNVKCFEQAHYGVPVRMAILDYVLSK